jgi:acyl-coenzyme A synthetase/AMP-(fatty) acid ligase
MLEHNNAIAECAVVGTPDTWGEQVACFMRPAGVERPDDARLSGR